MAKFHKIIRDSVENDEMNCRLYNTTTYKWKYQVFVQKAKIDSYCPRENDVINKAYTIVLTWFPCSGAQNMIDEIFDKDTSEMTYDDFLVFLVKLVSWSFWACLK